MKSDGLNYRVCHGLTKENKMDYDNPHYEFIKYCNCENCNYRLHEKREPSNSLTITTDNKENFEKITEIINAWTCDSSKQEERIFINMINGKTETLKGFGTGGTKIETKA